MLCCGFAWLFWRCFSGPFSAMGGRRPQAGPVILCPFPLRAPPWHCRVPAPMDSAGGANGYCSLFRSVASVSPLRCRVPACGIRWLVCLTGLFAGAPCCPCAVVRCAFQFDMVGGLCYGCVPLSCLGMFVLHIVTGVRVGVCASQVSSRTSNRIPCTLCFPNCLMGWE